jgi:hypothetical protein
MADSVLESWSFMRRTMMYRTCLAALFVLAVPGPAAEAQYGHAWWGSAVTPEGDYLRGLGIAGWGMGQYNLNTAQAESINVDTTMRWNEYLAAVAKEQTREYVMRKLADASQRKEFYKLNRDRIQNRPEARDVLNSDALNAILEQLENANLGESTLGTQRFQVPISADMIRRIPFKLSEKGRQFSMDRLCLKGKGAWTVALQDKKFEREKKAYALALDKALSQAIDGKMQLAAIKEVEDRAEDLFARLEQVVGRINDPLYIEARDRLKELKTTVELLKTEKIERAIGEIDKYSGTTVNELKAFMQRHNLRFAAALTPEERTLYPELYASLVLQREKLEIRSTPPTK